MESDAEFLRRYAEAQDEEAFTQLVQRHLPIVYSAALRLTGGDVHRAEDVSQTVFATLARKAASLRAHPMLTGWLYTTTHHVAARLVRAEWRRQRHEQAAQMIYGNSGDPIGADWEQIRPVIDTAMLQLTESDRTAVLLRFFENRPFAEIGSRLGLSEDTARMRVERALDALRRVLARRGIVSTAAALGITLSNQAIAAVPASLAASISVAATSSATMAGSAALFMSTIIKTGAVAVALLAGSVGLILQHRSNLAAHEEIAHLRSDARLAADLRAKNIRLTTDLESLAGEHAELLRLRQEVENFNRRISQPAPTKTSPMAGSWSSAANAPILAADNMGNATPQLGMQTMYWAIHNADAETFAHTLYLGSAKADWDAAFASLSAAEQQQLGSPEKIIAQEFLSDSSALKQITALQVLEIERQDDDNVILRVNLQDVTGKIREDITLLHRSDGGWQVPLPVSEVKKSLARFLKARS
jgi:RNA polymerase sigma factor (sigma-70 family)